MKLTPEAKQEWSAMLDFDMRNYFVQGIKDPDERDELLEKQFGREAVDRFYKIRDIWAQRWEDAPPQN